MLFDVTQKQFVDIKGINHLINQRVLDNSFEVENQIIKGIIKIELVYYSSIVNDEITEDKEIPYHILSNKDKIVTEINVLDMQFQVIDNQGIDIEFKLALTVIPSAELEKEEIVNELNQMLENALMEDERNEIIEEDNGLINNEALMYDLNESYRVIRVIYTSNDADVERIAQMYNKSVMELYASNNFCKDNRFVLELDEI